VDYIGPAMEDRRINLLVLGDGLRGLGRLTGKFREVSGKFRDGSFGTRKFREVSGQEVSEVSGQEVSGQEVSGQTK
jgi:hypothetical protein